MHQVIDDKIFMSNCVDDDDQFCFDFGFEDLDLAVPVESKSKDGMICISCKELYPYAEYPNQKDGTFKCWGCRHF